MRELLVDTCTGEEEDGTAHSFQYYILVDEMELSGGLSCESYGVKVQDRTERRHRCPTSRSAWSALTSFWSSSGATASPPSPCGTWFLIGFKSTRSAMTQGLRAAFD